MKKSLYASSALASGGMLGITIFINGELAKYSSPAWSSMVAHFVGIFGSWFLWRWMSKEKKIFPYSSDAPIWSYFGGISGAWVVVMANITVNSSIGLIGSFSLMILGQTSLAILFDIKGWFGMEKRSLFKRDLIQIFCILAGSIFILLF